MFHLPGRAGRRVSAVRGARAAADHRSDAAGQCVLDLLRADEMNVGVDAAGGDDAAFARDDFGRRADDHAGRDALLNAGIAGVAEADDAPILDPDVRLDDALHGVEHERVGDDQVERLRIGCRRRLSHAIADHFAAAKFHFVATRARFRDQIPLDFDEQLGVRQPHLIAHGGTEHLGILPSRHFQAHSLPSILLLSP